MESVLGDLIFKDKGVLSRDFNREAIVKAIYIGTCDINVDLKVIKIIMDSWVRRLRLS
jgi:hypothetical protein